jgi:glutaredoxin
MTNDIPRRLFSALARMQKITSFSKKYFSSTSSSRGPSSPLSSYMDSNTAPILIFHKSYCRVCKDLVERIEDGLSSGAMKEIAIDLAFSDRGDALREELRAKTGQKDVPFVFIGK